MTKCEFLSKNILLKLNGGRNECQKSIIKGRIVDKVENNS